MQFTSIEYSLFFLACFVVSWYVASQNNWRKLVLLFASYSFIALFDPRLAGLVFASSCFNYFIAGLLYRAPTQLQKRILFGVALAFNLCLLGVFKYFGFFAEALAPLLSPLGLERDVSWLEIAVPLGLSFFTLQALSYQIDVYRGKVQAKESFLDVHLLLSFFPKLIAGPLVSAKGFLSQFKTRASLTRDMVTSGLVLIVAGLIKKLVVADVLAAEVVDKVFTDPAGYSSLDVLFAIYGLAIQFYCDISGYCDIAIGCALLLGVKISTNFDRPYSARSLVDFWSRWYSSLTRFFVENIYLPMGGGSGGVLQTGRNIILTFLVAAWWHGTGFSFVAFFLFHALFMCGELLIAKIKPAPVVLISGNGSHPVEQMLARSEKGLRIIGPTLATLLTFHLVCIGWVIFKSENLAFIEQFFESLSKKTMSVELVTPYLMLLMVAAFSMHFLPQGFLQNMAKIFSRLHAIYLGLFVGFGMVAIQILGSPQVKPFIYSGL